MVSIFNLRENFHIKVVENLIHIKFMALNYSKFLNFILTFEVISEQIIFKNFQSRPIKNSLYFFSKSSLLNII